MLAFDSNSCGFKSDYALLKSLYRIFIRIWLMLCRTSLHNMNLIPKHRTATWTKVQYGRRKPGSVQGNPKTIFRFAGMYDSIFFKAVRELVCRCS